MAADLYNSPNESHSDFFSDWEKIASRVEALEGVPLNHNLIKNIEETTRNNNSKGIRFYTPTFKKFHSSEIVGCGKNAWPAISITGGDCKLQCDHCKAKILEPMLPARTPEELWKLVNEQIELGAQGILLTGGSDHNNHVEYGPYYSTIRKIKDTYPLFKIALHTALVDLDVAKRMEDSGIDAAMMDVIGSQDTITQVYHLKRSVDDFEKTLEYLVSTNLKVVPHIVIGLHYGRLLGEWNALEIVCRHQPQALVLVVVMPFYAAHNRPFATPDPDEVGNFFLDARKKLPEIPLLLGCARPPGLIKAQIDTYAVMAGLNGIAHPSDGMVDLAIRLGFKVKVTPTCCSITVGEEVLAMNADEKDYDIDINAILEHERNARKNRQLANIKVVSL